MPLLNAPTSFWVQQGNSQVYLSWDISVGATGYVVQRSTDGVAYTNLASPTSNSYLDTAVTVSTQYYYQVAAVNGTGVGLFTTPQATIPVAIGKVSLQQLRLMAQQRADRVNSQFLTLPEWNLNISNSYKEFYDLIMESYGNDYYNSAKYTITTDGSSQQYPLPEDFYKLFGAEIALNPGDPNSWVTLKYFEFIQRNLWNFPNVYTFYGITNLRYRIEGDTLYVVPIASAGQTIRLWYGPRPRQLMADTDTIDFISGWDEYIIIDAAIKALQKEESDVTILFAQKMAIVKRVQEAAANRNLGEPEVVSDSKRRNFAWGDPGDGFGYGDSGGWG